MHGAAGPGRRPAGSPCASRRGAVTPASRSTAARSHGRPRRPRLPDRPAALDARRRPALRPGRHAAADVPEQAHRRAARDGRGRARPARLLLRAGRPAGGPTSRICARWRARRGLRRSARRRHTGRRGHSGAPWPRATDTRLATPDAAAQAACPIPTTASGRGRRPSHRGGHPLLPVGQPRRQGHAGLDAAQRASAATGAVRCPDTEKDLASRNEETTTCTDA